MKVFQLVCVGGFVGMGGQFKASSRKVFVSQDLADKHKVEFLDKCCAGGIFDCDRPTAEIHVVELELVE